MQRHTDQRQGGDWFRVGEDVEPAVRKTDRPGCQNAMVTKRTNRDG